jgi:hypothetical protein
MKGFILGTIFGIMVSTIGFSGIAALGDRGVEKVQQLTKEIAQ